MQKVVLGLFINLHSKYVLNPNVTVFQSNCADVLHFSAFHRCN